jgi:DNA-binding transcriptional MerR regulator
MKIGQVARAAGVAVDTVRYYERRGLVPASRQASGYRSFTSAAVARIRLVRELQGLGLSLDEIAGVLRLGDRGGRACEDRPSVFDAALARLDEQLAELRTIRRRLVRAGCECREGRCLLAPT